MASVRPHPLSKYWICCYRTPDGKQHQKCSGILAQMRHRGAAIRMAEEMEQKSRAIVDPRLERFQKQMLAERLAETISDIHDPLLPKAKLTPLIELMNRWIENKLLCTSKNTYIRYKQVARDFLAFLGPKKAQYPPSYIQAQDIQDFIFSMSRKGQTPSSCGVKVKILRNLFNMGINQNMMTYNPAKSFEAPRGDRHTREPFTKDELKSLLAVADDNWKAMILLGANNGLRIKDAASLTWRCVDYESRSLKYFEKKKRHLKNARPRETYLHKNLVEVLLRLPVDAKSPDAPIFPRLARLTSSGKTGLSSCFARLMAKAGVDPLPLKLSVGRTFNAKSFHSLRHRFVSELRNQGVSLEIRKELAGHDSDVHRIYTHIPNESLRQAIDALPSLL